MENDSLNKNSVSDKATRKSLLSKASHYIGDIAPDVKHPFKNLPTHIFTQKEISYLNNNYIPFSFARIKDISKKYILILSFLWFSSAYIIYVSMHKSTLKNTSENLLFMDGMLALVIFSILYLCLLNYYLKFLTLNTILKINTIFTFFLSLKYIYSFVLVLRFAFFCPLPYPSSYDAYKKCQESLYILIKAHALNYNIFVIFIISSLSLVSLFINISPKKNLTFSQNYSLLFFATITLPILIEYLL